MKNHRALVWGVVGGIGLVAPYYIAIGLNPPLDTWGYSVVAASLRPWTYAATLLFQNNERALLMAPIGGMLINMALLFLAGYGLATSVRNRN